MDAIYIVNNKYHYYNLDRAIEQAKNILRQRAHEKISEDFIISYGNKGGINVHLNDVWGKVGNSKLLNVVIKKVSIPLDEI